MVSRRLTNGWSEPAPALKDFLVLNLGPAATADGKELYFETNHREPAIEGRGDTDIWVATRSNDGWAAARPVGPPFNSAYQEHNATISSKGTLCFNSTRPGGIGEHDIYCAARSDMKWSEPKNLGPAINSPSTDGAAHIAADETFIVFGSDRSGGFGGDDLYISIRRGGVWQPAVNLGPSINTAAGEWAPAVSMDGKKLLFTRTAGEGNSARFTLHETPFDASRYGDLKN